MPLTNERRLRIYGEERLWLEIERQGRDLMALSLQASRMHAKMKELGLTEKQIHNIRYGYGDSDASGSTDV